MHQHKAQTRSTHFTTTFWKHQHTSISGICATLHQHGKSSLNALCVQAAEGLTFCTLRGAVYALRTHARDTHALAQREISHRHVCPRSSHNNCMMEPHNTSSFTLHFCLCLNIPSNSSSWLVSMLQLLCCQHSVGTHSRTPPTFQQVPCKMPVLQRFLLPRRHRTF